MKTKLYIITALLIAAFGSQLFYQSYDFVEGFKDGFERVDVDLHPIHAVLTPNRKNAFYVLENLKSGNWSPTFVRSCIFLIDIPQSFSGFEKFNMIMSMVGFCTFFAFLYFFAILIISITKNRIFEWNSVHLLRKIGICMLILAFENISLCFFNYRVTSTLIELEGYRFNMLHLLDGSYLIIGMISFIIAEIFAIGLKFREEEELTI